MGSAWTKSIWLVTGAALVTAASAVVSSKRRREAA
jgi:hypothetical protein